MANAVGARGVQSRHDCPFRAFASGSGGICALAPAVALLALALAAGAEAQPPIGRLFTTPEQRVELDRVRLEGAVAGEAGPGATGHTRDVPEAPEAAPRVRAVRIDGFVRRADGRGVAWVNGMETVVGTTTPEGIRVAEVPARVARLRVRIPGGRGSTELGPGQTIDVASGAVLEAYEQRPAATRAAVPPALVDEQ